MIVVNDPEEHHGNWVRTRGRHELILPVPFRMGQYLTTNGQYLTFIKDKGYETDAYWNGLPTAIRGRFTCQDGKNLGPATWPSKKNYAPETENQPVTGISYFEALAFIRWLNTKEKDPGWQWQLPTEDAWELAARTEDGRKYPWGQEFQSGQCNSLESATGTTTDVNKFTTGQSEYHCFDMAGNVWEFVVATDMPEEGRYCILRGGSFKNNQYEVSSALRLSGVPRNHRAPDFGFRCSLQKVEISSRK